MWVAYQGSRVPPLMRDGSVASNRAWRLLAASLLSKWAQQAAEAAPNQSGQAVATALPELVSRRRLGEKVPMS